MSKPYRLLDLFSGIGGFSLGLERSGAFKTVAFCEIDPFCRRVLAKHWPGIPIYNDVTTQQFNEGQADVISAGFPCQDISLAGNGPGISGPRSGLFWQAMRAVRVVRPRFVLLENVAALLGRGMGVVLGGLASSGYDAEWDCIPAAGVGAPTLRDRVFIVAHSDETGIGAQQNIIQKTGIASPCRRHVDGLDLVETGPWSAMPDIRRVDYGIPGTMDRLGALGNAVVPQIPELIGRAILAAREAP